MQKIAAALGKSCSFEDEGSFTRLADLVEPANVLVDREPDWTRLRGFADQIALHPEVIAAATADPRLADRHHRRMGHACYPPRRYHTTQIERTRPATTSRHDY